MAVKHAKKKAKGRSKYRASWQGELRFGLVSFAVQAINAQAKQRAEIHFHLLHEPDRERIHYAKICPKHGAVSNDEIIEGYEFSKGHYVEFDKDELDALRTEAEKALTIDAFVSPDEIDPIYFDGRMYYLIPSGTSATEPYSLLEAAMEKKKLWGVGQAVFSGREQLALVRPMEGLLTMAMLNYEADIRKPAEIERAFTKVSATGQKLKLAEEFVAKWHAGKFDFGKYKDEYHLKIKQAIEAKKKGLAAPEPEEEEEPEVINLMEALQRSVAQHGSKAAHRRKPARSSHPKPKSHHKRVRRRA